MPKRHNVDPSVAGAVPGLEPDCVLRLGSGIAFIVTNIQLRRARTRHTSAMGDTPLMYGELAAWFHLLTPPGDYVAEAAEVEFAAQRARGRAVADGRRARFGWR